MKALTYLFIASLLLISCQNREKTGEDQQRFPPAKQQLVNWEKMNENEWKNLSFPTWFNEEIIHTLGIKKIEIDFISNNFTDTQFLYGDTLPYRNKTILFKENGEVKTVINTEYNAAIKISETILTYPINKNEIGYSLPIMNNKINFGKKDLRSQLNAIEELQQFHRLLLVEEHEHYYKFIDENDSEKKTHYFIIDSIKWNVTYIDQQFKPQGLAIYYYGTPTHYSSAFSLKNMVERSMKIEQERYENGVIKSQSFYEKDFITQRTFNFDNDGVIIGFSDSLSTINKEFIHSEIGVIQYRDNLPTLLSIYNEEDDSLVSPIKKIKFKYSLAEETEN